jgi:hypothetical protein
MPAAKHAGVLRQVWSPLGSVTMAGVVLRVRLTGGDHIDVAYDEDDVLNDLVCFDRVGAGVVGDRLG